MNYIYISDTNIWIDFRNADLLSALFQLPFTLRSTDFVISELDDFDLAEMINLGLDILSLDADAIRSLLDMTDEHNNSSLADVSCYYLAKQTGHPLLTGDGQLRKQAVKDGIQVHGALWLLDQLIEQDILTKPEAADGLTKMLACGARFPKQECDRRMVLWC